MQKQLSNCNYEAVFERAFVKGKRNEKYSIIAYGIHDIVTVRVYGF